MGVPVANGTGKHGGKRWGVAAFETAGLGPSGPPAGGDVGPLAAVVAEVAGGDPELERPWSPAPPKPIDILLGKLRLKGRTSTCPITGATHLPPRLYFSHNLVFVLNVR